MLDALPAHFALLDERGVIFNVNAAWKRFARVNGMASPDSGIGRDYSGLFDAACDDDAERAAAAIRSVLEGRSSEA